jgi:response regulator RpfG family c-di-GMP phosphodiesterase
MPINPLAEGLRPSREAHHVPTQTATLVADNVSTPQQHAQHTQIGYLLLVADDAAVRGQIAAHLRQRSFRVWQAASAESARAMLAYRVPDMLLLDSTLPGSEAFLQAVCAMPHVAHMPVLVITPGPADDVDLRGFPLDEFDAVIPRTEMPAIEAHITSVLFFKSEQLARALLMRFSQHGDFWQEMANAPRGPPA